MAPTAPFGDTPRLRGADQIFVENHAPFYSIFYAHSRLLSVVPVRIDEATLLTLSRPSLSLPKCLVSLSCHVLSPSLSYPFASFPSLLLYLSSPLLFFPVFVRPLQTPLTNFHNSAWYQPRWWRNPCVKGDNDGWATKWTTVPSPFTPLPFPFPILLSPLLGASILLRAPSVAMPSMASCSQHGAQTCLRQMMSDFTSAGLGYWQRVHLKTTKPLASPENWLGLSTSNVWTPALDEAPKAVSFRPRQIALKNIHRKSLSLLQPWAQNWLAA